jgi:hypothetical protein
LIDIAKIEKKLQIHILMIAFFMNWGENLSYCRECGAKLNETDKFCSDCGTAAGKIYTEEISVAVDNLVSKVKELLHEGNVNRIIVKDEKGNLLIEIPATVGVIGTVLAPWLAALGAITALVTNAKIVIERKDYDLQT